MAHAKPTLTIFADASVYHDKKVAGWAGYVRGEEKGDWFQGPAPYNADVDAVELFALTATVKQARDNCLILATDTHVLLQSDSLSALSMIQQAMSNTWFAAGSDRPQSYDKRARGTAGTYAEELKAILGGMEIVYLKHVKGHRNGVHARSWVNEQCDRRAKQESKKQMGGKK